MPMKKLLILYGFECSGHHAAALALREAFRSIDPGIEIEMVNFFAYASRLLEWFTTRAFYRMIRTTPYIWDNIYYNPRSEARFTRFRKLIRSLASRDAGDLLASFAPDAVVCTQAFPCGMLNDYKDDTGSAIPLYAVLTDYFTPSYWFYDRVDSYFVASEKSREELLIEGVGEDIVFDEGIPISPLFRTRLDRADSRRFFGLDPDRNTVAVMGGWSGWGSLEDLALGIGRMLPGCNTVVVTGRNRPLYESLVEKTRGMGEGVRVMEYVERIDALLNATDLLVGKAGGMTAAEALAAGTPLVLVDSLPGQERANEAHLCGLGAALTAEGVEGAVDAVSELIGDAGRRSAMRESALKAAKPGAALRIAGRILNGAVQLQTAIETADIAD